MPDFPVFQNPEFGTVRVVERDGEPWFAAKDVALALGYEWNGAARIAHVPEEWRGVTSVVTPSGQQEMLTLSEPGLYFFLGRSDKPKALPFQKWIAGDVLPAIRRTGGYMHATPADTPEAIMARAVLVAQDTIKRLQDETAALQAHVTQDRPKVIFADSIEVSRSTILVGEFAKLIKQSTGYDIGQRRMFDWLRDNGYLHKHGSQRNMPTQKSIDMGLFVIKEGCRIGSSGESHITKTPKVTGKGQIYFVNKFKELYESGRLAVLSVAQSTQEVEA